MTYPTCIWRSRWGGPIGISLRSLATENRSPCAIARRCFGVDDLMRSYLVQYRLVTDRRTDRHGHRYTALALRRLAKISHIVTTDESKEGTDASRHRRLRQRQKVAPVSHVTRAIASQWPVYTLHHLSHNVRSVFAALWSCVKTMPSRVLAASCHRNHSPPTDTDMRRKPLICSKLHSLESAIFLAIKYIRYAGEARRHFQLRTLTISRTRCSTVQQKSAVKSEDAQALGHFIFR